MILVTSWSSIFGSSFRTSTPYPIPSWNRTLCCFAPRARSWVAGDHIQLPHVLHSKRGKNGGHCSQLLLMVDVFFCIAKNDCFFLLINTWAELTEKMHKDCWHIKQTNWTSVLERAAKQSQYAQVTLDLIKRRKHLRPGHVPRAQPTVEYKHTEVHPNFGDTQMPSKLIYTSWSMRRCKE